ncbi:MAG TPA: GNAT family N-acetyltransferase [Terriglobales bacterium]|nr:GNAT family N-acetyltransferase [Terriglobales bacterium]
MDYFLKSAGLGFRCWTAEDLPLAMGLWGDSEVTTFLGGRFTHEMVRARLAKEIEQMKEHGMQYWPLFRLDSNQHVGCAGLRPYRMEERVYEFGVHLRRTFWRQGLAMEAGCAVIGYAFRTLNAAAWFAGHHPLNEASRELLMRLGFIHTHDELYAPTGLIHPSYLLHKASFG